MSRTAIAVCTYCRLHGLERTLASLENLKLADEAEEHVSVVIVDNSPDGTAADLCRRRAQSSRFKFYYVNEKRKGLSNARNAALAESRRIGATHLAFIDDDEMADGAWLAELLKAIEDKRCALAAGPSYPVFDAPPNRWLPVEAYAYTPLHRDGLVRDASSANMLIDLERLGRLGIEFDPAFNATGGEDTRLVSRLLMMGEEIAWAGGAVVWDSIPAARMQPTWLFRRWYRTGTTEARLSSGDARSISGRAKNAVKGLARLGFGSIRVLGGLFEWIGGGAPKPSLRAALRFAVARAISRAPSGNLSRSIRPFVIADYTPPTFTCGKAATGELTRLAGHRECDPLVTCHKRCRRRRERSKPIGQLGAVP